MSDPHFITTANQIKHPNRKKHTHTGSAWLLACPANRTKVFFRWQIRDGRHQEAARAVCNDTQASDEIVLQWYAIYPMWSSDRCRNGLLVLMFSPSETCLWAVSGLSKWGGWGQGQLLIHSWGWRNWRLNKRPSAARRRNHHSVLDKNGILCHLTKVAIKVCRMDLIFVFMMHNISFFQSFCLPESHLRGM